MSDMLKRKILVLSASSAVDGKSEPVSEALSALVAEVNGTARTHTFRAEELVQIAVDAEQRLSALPRKERIGAEVYAASAGPRAASYRSAAVGSTVLLKRVTAGWIVASYEKDRVYPTTPEKRDYYLSPAQIEGIARRAVADLIAKTDGTNHGGRIVFQATAREVAA